jgi:hypothetical protein
VAWRWCRCAFPGRQPSVWVATAQVATPDCGPMCAGQLVPGLIAKCPCCIAVGLFVNDALSCFGVITCLVSGDRG